MKQDDGRVELFLAHRAALVDYATPILGDRMRAEDVVQEAFIRFMPAQERQGGGVENPVGYLYRIVRNLALDWTRRRAGEERHREADPSWWMLPLRPRTPEEEAIHRQALDRVEAALASLSPEARIAVEMHRFDGHTLQEIAGRLRISVPTAHRLVRGALTRIAGQVAPGDG